MKIHAWATPTLRARDPDGVCAVPIDVLRLTAGVGDVVRPKLDKPLPSGSVGLLYRAAQADDPRIHWLRTATGLAARARNTV